MDLREAGKGRFRPMANKREGTCVECGGVIEKGRLVLYSPEANIIIHAMKKSCLKPGDEGYIW